MKKNGRDTFVEDLGPFMAMHGLSARWVEPNLLRLEHPADLNAPTVAEFEPGFWDLYETRTAFTQECARQNVLTQIELPYRPASKDAFAQVAHGRLSMLMEVD